jgi:hypothetical protein
MNFEFIIEVGRVHFFWRVLRLNSGGANEWNFTEKWKLGK